MELIITAVGMILAFLAGAYVRKPFEIIRREKEEAMRTLQEEPQRDKPPMDEQWNNFLSYSGKSREDD